MPVDSVDFDFFVIWYYAPYTIALYHNITTRLSGYDKIQFF